MIISGIQKLTLLDYPGKVACTIFTSGCNMRCPFCHNAALVLPERKNEGMSEDEFLEFLKGRRNLLDGVAITGGEPLLIKELPKLMEEIKKLGFLIKLDTNGSFPDRLRSVVEAGLVDRVAMDIKNSPENYARTVGVPGFDTEPVLESIRYLLTGPCEFEFRTTVVGGLHTGDDMRKIAQLIKGAPEYYIQAFNDSGDLICADGLFALSKEEINAFADEVRPFVPNVSVRGV
ncbi:MAG: anaerobic ribonucleoside-triphosphate reductase activating protein [Ruminococcaceae bacterium]|nr:anaerobic ribonucleoside-triphosphate reductase activating protein [Oscillospiraceae bacterium]